MSKIIDTRKKGKTNQPSTKVQKTLDNSYSTNTEVAFSAPKILVIQKHDDVATPFYSGYAIGYRNLTNENPIVEFSYGAKVICNNIERFLLKHNSSMDTVDFVKTTVSNWNEVREYLNEHTGGHEDIPNAPTLYTLRFYMGELLVWYNVFIGNGRSILATFGLPKVVPAKYTYISPPESEIVTTDQALDYLIDDYLECNQ